MDYSKLSEITVTNQEELDAVPDDFKGRIYIKCAATVSVRKRYRRNVEAYDNSSVEAWGNVQVVNRQINGKIKLSGNARQVFMPRNIHEFLDYYGVKHMVGSESFNVCLIGKGRKKVIGEFVCDWIQQYDVHPIEGENGYIIGEDVYSDTCLSVGDLWHYGGSKRLYGWRISNLMIYDKPKELSEFYTECDMGCEDCDYWKSVRVNADEFDMECDSGMYGYKPIKKPPQSWRYVEVLKGGV